MPLYEYRCADCDTHTEVHQSFTDDALTECPECGGRLKKLFGSVGIAFKGSGFYVNDSAKKSSSTSSSTNGSSESTASGSNGDSASSDTSKASDNGSSSAKPDAKKSESKTSDAKKSTASKAD